MVIYASFCLCVTFRFADYTLPNEDAVGKRKHGVEHQTKKGWHEKLNEQSRNVHLTKVDVVSVIHVGAVCRGRFLWAKLNG